MELKQAIKLTIKGRVQNVGFRFHTQDVAVKLGITGFVTNQPDGSVYIEAEGTETSLKEFIAWCHQGPTWAKVFEVDIENQTLRGFESFKINR